VYFKLKESVFLTKIIWSNQNKFVPLQREREDLREFEVINPQNIKKQ